MNQPTIGLLALLAAAVVLLPQAAAQERIELEGATVRSNQDAPKALYIVPWRNMSPLRMNGLEIDSLVNEELEPVDPEVFRRRVQLHQITTSAVAADAEQTASQ